jgi:phosphatidylethanolamine/phosphatidyl-N-methylethanolamine N-methyltransferase
VRMREQQGQLHGAILKLLLERRPQSADACAGIEDQNLIIVSNLDAGGVSAISGRCGTGSRNGTPDPPEANLEPIRAFSSNFCGERHHPHTSLTESIRFTWDGCKPTRPSGAKLKWNNPVGDAGGLLLNVRPTQTMTFSWIRSLRVFGRELMADPRPIGAACPSSPELARRVAKVVGSKPNNFILEIGAGTGSITAALLRDCVPMDRLIALERSPSMVGLLRQRFANLRVIEGDACKLGETLEQLRDVDPRALTHIVSSLPLRSLPENDVEAICSQFNRLLAYGAQLVQYTYNLRNGSGEVFSPMRRRFSSVVWFNIPPARVEVFTAAEARYPARSRPLVGLTPQPSFALATAAKPSNASPRH